MNKKLAITILGAASLAVGQQPVPPPADYRKAVAILKGDSPASPTVPGKGAKSSRRKTGAVIQGSIESSDAIEVQRQMPLPPSARTALVLSEGWLNSGPLPVQAPDGRVLYAYGQGVPVIVCSMLQVCELDLEAGEVPSKDALDWGDHRFEVAARTAGSGAKEFTFLVLKPTMPGLDTTMTIGTNKRPYYVRLVSTSQAHMARIGFSYPQDAEEKRKANQDAQKVEAERAQAEANRLAALNTAKPIRNWNYKVDLHGKDARLLRPEAIGDDGIHTYITMSAEAQHRGLPVVQLRDARGPIPANDRWEGNQLIIDAVFEHACLLEGVGRQQQRACITNQGLQFRGAGHGN